MTTDIDHILASLRSGGRRRIRKAKSHFYQRKYGQKIDNDRKESTEPHKLGADMDPDFNGQTHTEFFLSASSLNDHYISKLLALRIENGLDTLTVKENLLCDVKSWASYTHSLMDDADIQVIEYSNKAGMVVNHATMDFLDYSVDSSLVEVKLFGSKEYIEQTYGELKDRFSVANCYIEWVYGGSGESITIPLMPEKLPISEMYPFLGDETIESYYNRFLESSASILLLIGPPGTGKTTFIRGLLHHASKNAIVTYDEKILDRDYVFAQFVEGEIGVMVIEDADNFLKSRSNGNTMMHRFLNVGDGLISTKGKKLIFSTNLPSTNDIDSALTRPGRCFDIVSFENYTKEQAQNLAKKLGVDFNPKDNKSDTYSLAEIFHTQNNTKPKQTNRKMGFV